MLLKEKRGLVMGVANDRSIAWGIAKELSLQGAKIGFTYQTELFHERLKPLAKSSPKKKPIRRVTYKIK